MSRAIRMRRPRWWLGYGEWWYAEFEQWDPDSWDEVWIPLASKGKGKGKGKPAAEGKGNSPGNASAVTGGKGNAFSGQVLASKGNGLVWLLSGDGKGLASKGSASAVAGGKGNAAEGKGNAPGSASAVAWVNSHRWARAVTDHWAPGKRQRTESQPSSSAEWLRPQNQPAWTDEARLSTEVTQAELVRGAEWARARGLAVLMQSWRRLPEMPLKEYEQLILDYNNYPDGSSSSSSCVDSDQAFWCEASEPDDESAP